ncbi:MAG TPA: acetyl-CoA carboxylase carboxyltransferase subunit alpha [Candidatus Acidoferrales bacterium]|nr:acetyl-CoA carboxylase carboxyltransferase subunit alpha [Candidatus Acidoferrales bacterium]
MSASASGAGGGGKGRKPPFDAAKRRAARERLRRWQERARTRRVEEERLSGKPTQANPMDAHTERQKQIDELERDVAEMSGFSEKSEDLDRLRREIGDLKKEFRSHLNAWPRVQLARHAQRPYTEDFIKLLFENFSEIHGDRRFADDAAIVAGMARFHGKPVLVLGSQKGRDLKQRVQRNFGQAKPEGYRKALRAMQLATKFKRPIFVFVDTPGAYPGVDAEERGQAEALAFNLREMSRLPVPIIVTITGEGGSGGALAIAVGDRVLMLENSVYSVITPEGCASIIWRDSNKAELAAEALKMTAADLAELKLIDEIVPEPEGGAHTDHKSAAQLLEVVLVRLLDELSLQTPQQLVDARYRKFRTMGQFFS